MIRVGRETYGHQGIRIREWGEGAVLRIGSFCSIGEGVTVYLGGNHRSDHITTYPFGHIHTDRYPYHGRDHPTTKGDVNIGNDVWVCESATIMSGVTIGDGAIVGCCSVVSSNVPPYCIVAGNPARVVRKRFSEEVTQKLLVERWWDRSTADINSILPIICAPPQLDGDKPLCGDSDAE